MRSPICVLKKSMAQVGYTIAPEREAEMVALQRKFGLGIVFCEGPKFRIRVDTEKKEIFLPIGALEYLWASAHQYWILTQEYAAAQRSGNEEFDAHGNPRLQAAAQLRDWSLSNITRKGAEAWPGELPKPQRGGGVDDDVNVANELFLAALGWILHHEIGHVTLGHSSVSTVTSIEEEKAADLYATDWVLKGISRTDARMPKRLLGVVIALLTLQSLEIDLLPDHPRTHPSPYERIDYNLAEFRGTNQDVPFAFAAVVLQYLFAETSISAEVDGESFPDILDGMLVQIARREMQLVSR